MNTKPMKPVTQSSAKINLADAETIKCESCGNTLFIQSYVLKKISAIISPSGKEEMITIPVFSCGNCGQVPSDMLKVIGNDK